MIDNQRVTWTAFAILAMFNIHDSERESENPAFYFENGDGIHVRKMAGNHIFTKAVIKSIQPLIDIV